MALDDWQDAVEYLCGTRLGVDKRGEDWDPNQVGHWYKHSDKCMEFAKEVRPAS